MVEVGIFKSFLLFSAEWEYFSINIDVLGRKMNDLLKVCDVGFMNPYKLIFREFG